jgi:glutathione peroxidase
MGIPAWDLRRVWRQQREASMSARDHSFGRISGGDLPLSSFAGRPVLVVNTTSECEYTPQ